MKKAPDKKLKIAYLAPEIPSVSDPFVYSEILELEKLGLSIMPISMRKPVACTFKPMAHDISQRTSCLPILLRAGRVRNAAAMARSRPEPFMRAFILAAQDTSSLKSLHAVPGMISRFLAAAMVAGTMLRSGCTHIHAHFAHTPADIAMYAARIADVPFSFTAHGNDLFSLGRFLKEKVQRCAFAVAASENARGFLVKKTAMARKIRLVHCGVDPGSFPRREDLVPGIPVQIGSLGRMADKRELDLLLDACRILQVQGMPLKLELAGDGPLKQEMVTRAYLKGLGRETAFVGNLGLHNAREWLKGMDVFVLARRKGGKDDMDGIPALLMQAMLSGVPVVSTGENGVSELIRDRVTGWLSDRPNAGDLARAIQAALQDGGVGSGILCNAEACIREGFDAARNALTLARLFKGEVP